LSAGAAVLGDTHMAAAAAAAAAVAGLMRRKIA